MALSPEATRLSTAKSAEAQRLADQREADRQQRGAAFDMGYLHVQKVVGEMHPEATSRDVEHALIRAFDECPLKCRAYGDEGHRPDWFRGFNERMMEHFGIGKTEADTVRDAMHGISLDGRTRIRSMAEAMEAARFVTEALDKPEARRTFWAEDRTSSTSPRYAIIRAFVVGEPVSYGFNGDSYPCGRVTKITSSSDAAPKGEKREEAGYRIITTEDVHGVVRKFWRRGLTGRFVHEQTWGLQHGWHADQNPSF